MKKTILTIVYVCNIFNGLFLIIANLADLKMSKSIKTILLCFFVIGNCILAKNNDDYYKLFEKNKDDELPF